MKIPKLNSFQFDSRLQNPIPAIIAGVGALGSMVSGQNQLTAQREANLTNLRIANQTNEMNRYIADQANQWSAMMQRENNQFNRDMALEMFEKENAYNDPREQVKRMIGAGVNPYASGNGAIAQSTGDISTPTAASVPSPAVATMQAATVQPEPTPWTGFFQNVRDFAQVFDTLSSSRLKDSERNRIETLLKPELEKMIADKENQEANTAFTKVDEQLKQLELAVGRKTKLRKAIEDIRFVHNQAALAKYKGETEKAQKLFTEAQEKLANQEYKFKDLYNPEIIKNVQEERELTIQKQNTEKSMQDSYRASAENSRANAQESRSRTKINEEEHKRLVDTHDDFVRIQHLIRSNMSVDFKKAADTMYDYINQMHNANLISDEEYNTAKAMAEQAVRNANWQTFDKIFGYVERLNNGVNKWAPYAFSRTDEIHNYGTDKEGNYYDYMNTRTSSYHYNK